jgi:hypothetical protein
MNMKKSIILVALLVAFVSTACGQTVRRVTAKEWVTTGATTSFYAAYWEASCGAFGCLSNMSKIKECKLIIDENVLACKDSESAAAALNPQ